MERETSFLSRADRVDAWSTAATSVPLARQLQIFLTASRIDRQHGVVLIQFL
jgi:hypothetical protein